MAIQLQGIKKYALLAGEFKHHNIRNLASSQPLCRICYGYFYSVKAGAANPLNAALLVNINNERPIFYNCIVIYVFIFIAPSSVFANMLSRRLTAIHWLFDPDQ
jgi:hypothetical protein